MLEYFPKIENGKISSGFIKDLERDFAFLEGKHLRVQVEKARSKRSLAQNRMYWGWIKLLSDHTGIEKNELHDLVKYKFLKEEKVDQTTGEIYFSIKSTTTLNKTQFSDFARDIDIWTKEFFSVTLPMPDGEWELQFN